MISISYNSETGIVSIDDSLCKALDLSDDEKAASAVLFSFIPSDLLPSVRLERRSKDYVSFICGENDFLRLKCGNRSKWLSLHLPSDIAAQNVENPLFAAQSNKNQLHWRASLSSLEDLPLFKDLVSASCVYMS